MLIRKRKDGTPILCKFCKKPVVFDDLASRILEEDGTPHVDNCEARRAHYSGRGFERQQGFRDQKQR